jgi:serine/threonine protein kinase
MIKNEYYCADLFTYIQFQPKARVNIIQANDFLLKLARSLANLHDIHIYHGDVKSENVVIDSARKLYLIDFGGSGVSYQDVSIMYRGSIAYASPEALQVYTLETVAYDPFANDVYSLGIGKFYSHID